MSSVPTPVHEQFNDIEQQREASTLGMWTFLATEVLFFGGLFMGYTAYRVLYPNLFLVGSEHLKLYLGGMNTGILLTSSFTMALAVQAAHLGRRKALVYFLVVTAALGLLFLGVKGYEYHQDFAEHLVPGVNFAPTGDLPPNASLFFWIYFAMTGLHAIHVLVGTVTMATLAFLAYRGHYSSDNYMTVENAGLYWHFVDIVWVFLFPLLYMVGHR